MLTFLPLLLLLLIVILVEFLSRSKLNIGNQWLILVLAVVFTWVTMIFIHSRLPDPVVIDNWFPAQADNGSLVFTLDNRSWNYSFALISLLAGMILVNTIHLHEQSNIRDWSRVIFLFGMGILCSIVDSLLAFILSWMLFDIVELVVQFLKKPERQLISRIISILFLHFLGTILVVAVMIKNGGQGNLFEMEALTGSDFSLLLLGAWLRMTFYSDERDLNSEKGIIGPLERFRQFLPPFLAMVFLSRVQKPESLNGILVIIFLFSILLALFSSVKWFFKDNSSKSTATWVALFSALALISAIRGQMDSIESWAILMLVVGMWIKLFTFRHNRLLPLVVIISLSLLGFPFSPSAAAYAGITSGPFEAFNVFLWLCMIFLIAGIIKSSLRNDLQKRQVESWMKLFYLLGISLVTISPWLGILGDSHGSNSPNISFASIIVVSFLLMFMVFSYIKPARQWLEDRLPTIYENEMERVLMTLDQGSAMMKLADAFNSLYESTKRLVNRFTEILEGEGGILWAFVFLALLISLLASNLGS